MPSLALANPGIKTLSAKSNFSKTEEIWAKDKINVFSSELGLNALSKKVKKPSLRFLFFVQEALLES